MGNHILKVINGMSLIQTFHIKNLNDPWILHEILDATTEKDRVLSAAKRSNHHEDLILARRRRNEVKQIVKNAKSEFIKQNLELHENDSGKFWKSLKDIIPSKNNSNSNTITLNNDHGDLINNPKDTANEINSFFTLIGPNLAIDENEPWIYSGNIIADNIPDFDTNRN